MQVFAMNTQKVVGFNTVFAKTKKSLKNIATHENLTRPASCFLSLKDTHFYET